MVVKEGDEVFFSPSGGEIDVDGQEFLILDQDAILASGDPEVDAVLRHLRLSEVGPQARARAARLLAPDEVGPLGPKWPSAQDGLAFDLLRTYVAEGEQAALSHGIAEFDQALVGLLGQTRELEQTVERASLLMGSAA